MKTDNLEFEMFGGLLKNESDIKGIGLGFSLSNKILKMYESKLEIKSQENEGTSVSFILNLKKQ